MMKMKMLQLVVLIALFAICHADVPNKPITVNALAPNSALSDANPANELSEWGEYKVNSSLHHENICSYFCIFVQFCDIFFILLLTGAF